MFLQYLKSLIELVLSPKKAWGDIAQSSPAPGKALERGLYPLMAIMALTAFCHGFYGGLPLVPEGTTGIILVQIKVTLAQFIAVFLTVLIARGIFEATIRDMSSGNVPMEHVVTVPIYVTGLLTLIQIIANLCPVDLTLFWFLPAFLTLVLWHARDYLQIASEKSGIYIVMSIGVLIIMPETLIFIFNLLL